VVVDVWGVPTAWPFVGNCALAHGFGALMSGFVAIAVFAWLYL
jgi:hypothetical protein